MPFKLSVTKQINALLTQHSRLFVCIGDYDVCILLTSQQRLRFGSCLFAQKYNSERRVVQ